MDNTIRIGVLEGGCSSEREVSLKSGAQVISALSSRGFDVVGIDIKKENKNHVRDLIESYDIGFAFLALHGGFGEDGRVQEILEEMSLPYTGSGPKASALAMDKASSHKVFAYAGLKVPKHCVLDKQHRKVKELNSFPVVVKPADGGSSIGLSIVDSHQELRKAVDNAFKYSMAVLVEEYIAGREMTVGILEDRPLPAIEIKPKRRFFDYKAKYENSGTEYIVPALLKRQIEKSLKEAALAAHKALGCSFFSRVDLILDNNLLVHVLEVNTIPGFTTHSLLPMAAQQEGISFQQLVLKITQAGFKKGVGSKR